MLGGWNEGKRLRSEASCAVPSDTELCSVAGTRASVYEAKLRAQSRATPSYARWLERGQAFTKRSFVRSPERHRAMLGGWNEGKRLRSEASCAVPSDTELCSVAGTRASVYEAKLRAQSRATPSYARWLERGQAFTKRSFVRSPERHRAMLGGWTVETGNSRSRKSRARDGRHGV